TSIAGDLPAKGTVYTLAEDHEKPELLFAGTEFGVFFTIDAGQHWVQLESGVPTIAVRDIELQRRENDLVLGTFGRGFFILDDYTPLRSLSEEALEAEAILFTPRNSLLFNETFELGYNAKAFQGDAFYTAPNPPLGVVFTYYLEEEIETLEDQRHEAESELEEAGGSVSYPSWEELRREDREQEPMVVLTVRDQAGEIVRRVSGPTDAGIHRVSWDLRYPSPEPVELEERPSNAFSSDPIGPMVVPGVYTVTLAQRVRGEWRELAGPVSFEAAALELSSLPAPDRAETLAFHRRTAALSRAVSGAVEVATEAESRLSHLRQAATDTAGGSEEWVDRIDALGEHLANLLVELTGDPTLRRHNEPTPPSIASRAERATSGWTSSAAPTGTHRRQYEIAAEAFGPVLAALRELIETDLAALEAEMEAEGAPWTPGRMPVWGPE
ncbi:MAG: glycosyl hydrolase, partial [Acidobacteria bacterium]|nr:glycosyl hydrolase [Acidobacteriota bacterium]